MLSQRQAECIILFVTIIAAFGWICSKEAITELPVIGFIGIRFLLAGLVIAPWSIRYINTINATQFVQSIIAGLLMTSNLVCWVYGVATTSSLGEGAFIVSLSMLFVPLISWLILKIRPSQTFWLAFPCAIVGLVLLALTQNNIHFEMSHIFFLLSATAQAFYFFYASLFSKNIPLITFTTIQLVVTGIVSLILSYFFEKWPITISDTTIGWLAASVIIATTLRFMLQLIGQKYTTTENASIVMVNEPVMVFIVGVWWYNAPVNGVQIFGCILILLSLLYYRCGNQLGQYLRHTKLK